MPGDVVLADRGFNVEECIAYRGATLNIPAFTRGNLSFLPKSSLYMITCRPSPWPT